jgi:hypothetical protein
MSFVAPRDVRLRTSRDFFMMPISEYPLFSGHSLRVSDRIDGAVLKVITLFPLKPKFHAANV